MIGRLEPERFAQVVAARAEDHDPASSLCLACTDVLDVTGAGLMLVSGERSLGCVGVSDGVTAAVEQVEFTLGEGPCVAAYRTRTPSFDWQASVCDKCTRAAPSARSVIGFGSAGSRLIRSTTRMPAGGLPRHL